MDHLFAKGENYFATYAFDDIWEIDGQEIKMRFWHRPLAAYMTSLIESGLHLAFFSEPEPVSGEASRREDYRRVPWFVVMEWRRPSNP